MTRASIVDGVKREAAYKQMPDETLTQANPVSGTKYVVLDTKANVRIISVAAWVTWTVQPTPMEVHITIDGNTITHSQSNPVSNNGYEIVLKPDSAENAQTMDLVATNTCNYCSIFGHI